MPPAAKHYIAPQDPKRSTFNFVPLRLLKIITVASLHWGQFLALFGFGAETARFNLVWKNEPLPVAYVITMMVVILMFEFLLEELVRGLRANAGKLIPNKAREGDLHKPPAAKWMKIDRSPDTRQEYSGADFPALLIVWRSTPFARPDRHSA